MASADLLALLWTQTWQLAVVVLLVAIAVRCFAARRPHWAHAFWCVALLKALTPPIIASPLALFPSFDQPAPAVAPSLEPAGEWTTIPIDVSFAAAPREEAAVPAAQALPAEPPAVAWSWTDFAIALWWGGASIVALVSFHRYRRALAEICSDSPITAEEWQAAVDRWRSQLGIRAPVRVRIVRGRFGPAVFGLFRPTIILPAALVEGRSPNDLAAVLVHELVHVRRRDAFWGALLSLASIVLWFHPLVWWLQRSLVAESERCCDLETLAATSCPPATYARQLLEILDLKLRPPLAPAIPGIRSMDVTRTRLETVMKT
ncbi:MAG TPA: M56 family metallopeptidase, partial [Planctomycetia bacterium]|nr:M56 family metallopeptidase [Planctomycetia bacterium]